ncbi:MAG: pantoate kinase [Nitrososphaera sp.]
MASTLIAAPVSVAKAFSPGHITGFFEIPANTDQNYLHRGSKGAGFCLDRGISTEVHVYESARTAYEISINDVRTVDAEVSRWVVDKYLKLADRPYFVTVDHDVGIPVGYGLGSSGAAALSLSYALNEAFKTGFSKAQAAQIAHHVEISCGTGLGTVIAEFAGGFELRTHAGAPGIGNIVKLDLHDYKAIVLCLAPISTKSFLNSRMDEINGLGGVMLRKLSTTKNIGDFMSMSAEFAESLGLTGGICREPINSLRSRGFEASVALFGHTVFTLVPRSEAREARDSLRGFGGTLLVCGIASDGAKVL